MTNISTLQFRVDVTVSIQYQSFGRAALWYFVRLVLASKGWIAWAPTPLESGDGWLESNRALSTLSRWIFSG